MNADKIQPLFSEMDKLAERYNLSQEVSPDYFEPGMMEYLDKSFGSYNIDTGEMILRFEVKGTRYEGRSERIEKINVGDKIIVKREPDNIFNSNNFGIFDGKVRNLGNMPADLCNALAPLFDAGDVKIIDSFVSFVEPISKRSRYAKKGVLFVEIHLLIYEDERKSNYEVS